GLLHDGSGVQGLPPVWRPGRQDQRSPRGRGQLHRRDQAAGGGRECAPGDHGPAPAGRVRGRPGAAVGARLPGERELPGRRAFFGHRGGPPGRILRWPAGPAMHWRPQDSPQRGGLRRRDVHARHRVRVPRRRRCHFGVGPRRDRGRKGRQPCRVLRLQAVAAGGQGGGGLQDEARPARQNYVRQGGRRRGHRYHPREACWPLL
ncbi:unnamed protein product, partial [Prorocentrum cordatum]